MKWNIRNIRLRLLHCEKLTKMLVRIKENTENILNRYAILILLFRTHVLFLFERNPSVVSKIYVEAQAKRSKAKVAPYSPGGGAEKLLGAQVGGGKPRPPGGGPWPPL